MKFQMVPLVNETTFAARLGTGTGAANHYAEATEKGKFVKFVGESRYALAALGDEIEGRISSINVASADGYSLGAVTDPVGPGKFMNVTFDGLQGTPGTGTCALGAYVLVGTVVAKDTALVGHPRVVQATTQASAKATPFAWRVVSHGSAGTGAPGTVGVIQRVGA